MVMAHKIRVYPHNDLFNLAHYHRHIINHKVANNDEDGLALDCLSCLISLAFTVESLINFVGSKKIKGWRERQSFRTKMTEVCDAVGLSFDENKEPFATIWKLKVLRDLIAHGHPFETVTNISSREEMRRAMECPWDEHLDQESVS